MRCFQSVYKFRRQDCQKRVFSGSIGKERSNHSAQALAYAAYNMFIISAKKCAQQQKIATFQASAAVVQYRSAKLRKTRSFSHLFSLTSGLPAATLDNFNLVSLTDRDADKQTRRQVHNRPRTHNECNRGTSKPSKRSSGCRLPLKIELRSYKTWNLKATCWS